VVQLTELTEIRRVAGPEWQLRDALQRVRFSKEHWQRAKRLQDRWGLDLGAR
jgi:hypothetical protein